MTDKQKKIEALELAKNLIQDEIDNLKGDGMQTMDGGPKNPIPPDPTHPPQP